MLIGYQTPMVTLFEKKISYITTLFLKEKKYFHLDIGGQFDIEARSTHSVYLEIQNSNISANTGTGSDGLGTFWMEGASGSNFTAYIYDSFFNSNEGKQKKKNEK